MLKTCPQQYNLPKYGEQKKYLTANNPEFRRSIKFIHLDLESIYEACASELELTLLNIGVKGGTYIRAFLRISAT
ncbi:hypothetical protein VIGAN_04128600, partial [Vigna angularis var. angularis]